MLVEYKLMKNRQVKIRSLTLLAMITLVGVSVSSCSFNDSQERQWARCQERVCQALDGGHVQKAEGVLQEELKRLSAAHNKYLESRCLSALGKIYRYSGQPQKAEEPLKSLVALDESADNLVLLADCYIDQKKYEQAIELLSRAVDTGQAKFPGVQLIPCQRKLARCFEAMDKKDKAQAHYQLAIDADANQQKFPEKERSNIVIFDEANLMWDYSSFLARQNQKGQSDALEARADHLFKILVERAGPLNTDEKNVLGFPSDSEGAKAANLVNVLVAKGKYADAEALLERLFSISVDLAGFADNEAERSTQFIDTFQQIWCAEISASR
jgi:tetratricopeptide (TPR) repeat protein